MSRNLTLALFLSISFLSVVSAAESVDCMPTKISSDGSSIDSLECKVETSDAGNFVLSISSSDALMRLSTSGSIRSVDMNGVKLAIKKAFDLKYPEAKSYYLRQSKISSEKLSLEQAQEKSRFTFGSLVTQ